MISLEDWATSSGSYKERATSPELTKTKLLAAEELLKRVNALLKHLGVTEMRVSSGFRTVASNAATKGAAPKSNHMKGTAIDLASTRLHALITVPLLIEFNLYMEDPKWTKGWTHLQTTPTKSGRRIFMP